MSRYGYAIDSIYYCSKCGWPYFIYSLASGGFRKDCPKCDWDNMPPMVKDYWLNEWNEK